MKVEAIPDHPTQTITVGRKLEIAKDGADPIRVKARQINNEIAAPKIGSETINISVKNIVAECAECF